MTEQLESALKIARAHTCVSIPCPHCFLWNGVDIKTAAADLKRSNQCRILDTRQGLLYQEALMGIITQCAQDYVHEHAADVLDSVL